MCIVRYPLRYASVVCIVIGLLILSPVVYFFGGCVGTYELLFSNANDSGNTTSSLDRAIKIVQNAYNSHGAPDEFHKWGVAFLVTYIVVVALIGLIMCARTACECGRELRQMSESDRDRSAVQSLRSEYEMRQFGQL